MKGKDTDAKGNDKYDLTGGIRDDICSRGLAVGCRRGGEKEKKSAGKIFGHSTGSIVTAHCDSSLSFPFSTETE